MYFERAILVGKTVVPEPDVIKWATWFESNTKHRIVKQTTLNRRRQIMVSTVFLGYDHGITKRLWFESLVFGTSIDGTMERYATYDEAELGHARMVFRARQAKQIRYRYPKWTK
jgi:hypothetical protein